MKFVLYVTILFQVAIHFTSAVCAPSEWECLDGTCIFISDRCDNVPSCDDGSDEINCADTITCSEGQRKCFHSYGNFTCTNSATPCDCGSPGNIMYGTATLDDPTNSSAGATASVTCHNGYQASTPSLTCLPTGLWNYSSCTAKDCGHMPPISAGSITLIDPKNTTYGASATVTCFTGYQANVTSVSCLASGLWESASCTIIDCGQLPPISSGSITLIDPNNTTYGASATVTCFTGYQANVTSVTCLASGLWESASCAIIDCGQLPPISAGSMTLVDPKNTTYGASATVTCFTGYQANVTSVSCLASGLWESASCAIIVCGQLPPISSGSTTLVDPKNTTYGASATVTCFTGYQANVTLVTCLASGLWESASCTVIVCGPVPNISFGIIHLTDNNNVSYGAEALVECDDEYVATKLVIKCLASGQWDMASCEEKASPAATLTPKDNNTAMIIIIIVASIIGGPCLIQLTVATGLHIKIYSEYTSNKGKAAGYILLSALPYIGILFMIRFYKWGAYKKYYVNNTKKLRHYAASKNNN